MKGMFKYNSFSTMSMNFTSLENYTQPDKLMALLRMRQEGYEPATVQDYAIMRMADVLKNSFSHIPEFMQLACVPRKIDAYSLTGNIVAAHPDKGVKFIACSIPFLDNVLAKVDPALQGKKPFTLEDGCFEQQEGVSLSWHEVMQMHCKGYKLNDVLEHSVWNALLEPSILKEYARSILPYRDNGMHIHFTGFSQRPPFPVATLLQLHPANLGSQLVVPYGISGSGQDLFYGVKR